MKRQKKIREEWNKEQRSSSFFRKSANHPKRETVISQEEEEAIKRYIRGGARSKEGASFVEKQLPNRRKRSLKRKAIVVIFSAAGLVLGGFVLRVHLALGTKSDQPATLFSGKASASGAHNLLLLGTDQREGQGTGAARADSIMVLQIDGADKRPKIVSFLRDLLVDIPNVGVAGQTDCKLNAAYGIGEQGSAGENNQHQGVELVRETLKNNFGIDCSYYAVVNFSSFATVIDSLFPEGIPIDAKFGTINGEHLTQVPVPDDLATTQKKIASDVEMGAEEAAKYGYEDPAIYQMIREGKQKMDGRTALNYARFRHDDENDFGRVKRQQQVMEAITSQAKSFQTILKTPQAIQSILKVTSTNVERLFLYKTLFTVFASGGGRKIDRFSVPEKDDSTCTVGLDKYGGQGIDIDRAVYRRKVREFLGESGEG